MEKKLGVFFTTIVTHINNNATTLSISSLTLTQTSKQPFLFPLSLSLPYAHFCVSIYFTDPLSLLPSIITPVLLPPSSSLRLISSPPASRWRPNEGVVYFNLV